MPASEQLAEITAHVVAAYVEKNSVSPSGLPELIAAVSGAFASLGQPAVPAAPALVPAVNPKKSVHDDYLISLEDGQKYKTLRRHLSGRGLTPDEYRAKWGLPDTYPMVAPNYSARRSELAKALGLGRKPKAKPPSRAKKR